LDFGHGNLIDAQVTKLSRDVTSRSQDTQKTHSRLMSKREVKIAALERTISALMAVGIEDTEERKERESAQLVEFLNSPFKDEL
jgi:hypothetical protein